MERPIDISQMTGTKRKRLEIADVDSQKMTEKENVTYAVAHEEIPRVSSSSKKRFVKQTEKASTRSN